MIAKCTTGSGFRGALNYDLGQGKDGQPRGVWVAGSLIGSPREMAAQAAQFRALRPDCKKAIFRVSLSANPSDGFLDEKKWAEIARDFLGEMEIDPKTHAWVAIRHRDYNKAGQPHDHIHLSVVRASSNGQLWNQEFSARRAIKATEILEQKHGLVSHAREPPDRRRPQIDEQKLHNRKGKIQMPREKITAAIDQLLAEHPEGLDRDDFLNRLAARGVKPRASMTQSGRLQGFSFEMDGITFPGSKLGADYGLSGLLQRGVRSPKIDAAEKKEPFKSVETEKQTVPPEKKEDEKDEQKEEKEQPQQAYGLIPAPPTAAQSLVASQARGEQYNQRRRDIMNHNGIGPLSKALLLLGTVISQFAMEIIARFIDWIRAKLAKWFGIDLQSSVATDAAGQRQVAFQPQIIDVESKFVDPKLALEDQSDKAADWVNGVTKKLQAGTFDFDALPSTPVQAPVQAQPTPEARASTEIENLVDELAAPASEYKKAFDRVELLLDLSTPEAHALGTLRGNISAADQKIEELEAQAKKWIDDHPVKARFSAPPGQDELDSLKQKLAAMQERLDSPDGKDAARRVAANAADVKDSKTAVALAKNEFLGALRNVEAAVKDKTASARWHKPTEVASLALVAEVEKLHKSMQFFVQSPSRAGFESKYLPLKNLAKSYDAALSASPLPVEKQEQEPQTQTRKQNDWQDPDTTQVPRG